jgi:hypothetical protein
MNEGKSNKLDFVLQFEKEKERRMSDIYVDILDRSRSISGITRDEELEKLNDLLLSSSQNVNNDNDEEMPFAVAPTNSNDIASSVFGYANRGSSMGNETNESNTYYSLAVSD